MSATAPVASAAARAASGAASNPASRRLFWAILPLLCGLLLLSGAAGLIYQVAWVRLLGLSFGVTVHAISTVLAAFMGGLAIGSVVGGRLADRIRRPLLVYALSNYRNSITGGIVPDGVKVIPQRVIDRPPSAELRPDQKDSDSLPPYEVLDAILELFIEEDLSVDDIAARGFDRNTVGRVLDMVKRNEYKRRQAPPGVRISDRAFGRDWRYPITSGYRTR